MIDWLLAPDYSLGRLIVQRGIAVVYLIAFLVAVNQFRPLLGENGLLPVPRYLRGLPFRRAPSIFHVRYSDRLFAIVAWTGVLVSAAILAGVLDRAPIGVWLLAWFVTWVLYLSIVNVGQIFFGFGWESLLLEAGFLAMFLGPASVQPLLPGILLVRWLLFRLEFGAGLIKLRGDPCWKDLTCLYYHHETQPMPNRLSWFFHHLPKPLHKLEVAANHFAQLVVPFGLFAPQPVASIAGAVIVVTQSWLVVSGNFSWLNTVTIVLAFAAFDDSFLEAVLPLRAATGLAPSPLWYTVAVGAAAVLVVVLSYWPVRNMLSSRQYMNYSFNPFHLVNTYGAFGSITRERNEVIIEGSADPAPGPDTEWREYEFKGKPGDPRRRPPQIAPYHLRLDWLMWFLPFSPAYAQGWLLPFMVKLLENDRATLKLLRKVPFPDEPPAVVRARLFRYRFTTRAERRATGAWWHRHEIGEYVPPVALEGRLPRRGTRRAV